MERGGGGRGAVSVFAVTLVPFKCMRQHHTILAVNGEREREGDVCVWGGCCDELSPYQLVCVQ